MQIAYIVFGGLSSAISILIGNRLGANEIEEAKTNSYRLLTFGVMIGIVMGTTLIFVAPVIASFYNVEDIIKQTIVSLLSIKSILLPIYVYNVCIFFTLRAGGDTFSTMLMDSGFLWCAGAVSYTHLPYYSREIDQFSILNVSGENEVYINNSIYCSPHILKLYNSNTPYESQKWVLMGIIDKSEL